jgi:ParB/RepB/Spo0J family partition protein
VFEIIPIDKLVPSADNPRRKVGDVRDLASSIAAVGVIEPLVVVARPEGGYQVVAGHRRLAAARTAGLSEVPCTVRELSEAERIEIALVENLVRSDLRPVEEAGALFRLVEMGQSVKALSSRIGRSAKHITSRLALLELPPKVQAQVDAGKVTVTEASALLALKDHPDAIESLLSDEWKRGDLERQVVREVTRIEAEVKVAAGQEALAAEGVRVIEEWSPYGGRGRSPVALGNGPGELPVEVVGHRHEPCHGAHVGRRGDVTHLCTDPARHAPGGGSSVIVAPDGGDTPLDRREERANERRAAKARSDAALQRAAFLSELARRKLPKADVAALVLDQFIAGARREPVRVAAQLLGVAPVAGPYGDDWHATLRAHASAGPGQRERAALALALAIGEEDARQSRTSSDRSPVAGRHFAFLLAFGYEPSEGDGLPDERPPTVPDEEGLAKSTAAD